MKINFFLIPILAALQGCATTQEFWSRAGEISSGVLEFGALASEIYLDYENAGTSSTPSSSSNSAASSATGGACGAKLTECKKYLGPNQYCTVSNKPNGVCCVGKHESNGFVVSTSCNNGFGSAN